MGRGKEQRQIKWKENHRIFFLNIKIRNRCLRLPTQWPWKGCLRPPFPPSRARVVDLSLHSCTSRSFSRSLETYVKDIRLQRDNTSPLSPRSQPSSLPSPLKMVYSAACSPRLTGGSPCRSSSRLACSASPLRGRIPLCSSCGLYVSRGWVKHCHNVSRNKLMEIDLDWLVIGWFGTAGIAAAHHKVDSVVVIVQIAVIVIFSSQ